MKSVIILLGTVIAGFFGYTLEPQLRSQLTGESRATEPALAISAPPSELPPLVAPEPLPPPSAIIPATPTEAEPPVSEDPAPPEEAPAIAAPEPAAAPAIAASSDPVEAMQASIRGGKIKEFTFEQVLKWEPAPDENVDGETFKIGLASYKATTIFGEKTIQAKALIKDGIVQKWIWPKSGMEIK